jgi:hypothetical protein
MAIFNSILLGQRPPEWGSPILQHFDVLFTLFRKSQARAKYLGDVDDVDDVPLIIAATPDAAAVYGTDSL